MNNIKQELESVLELIGDDIEDRKISEIENIYSIISETKEKLRLIIVAYKGRIKNPLILKDERIIDYFETYLPMYKKQTRERDVIAARFLFVFLMHRCARKTLDSIGKHPAFNKVYDHTTMIHACQTLIDMYYTNDQLIMPLIEHASKELDLQIGTIIELESEKLEEKRSLKLC